jgi:hypothetical protein
VNCMFIYINLGYSVYFLTMIHEVQCIFSCVVNHCIFVYSGLQCVFCLMFTMLYSMFSIMGLLFNPNHHGYLVI